MTRRWFARLLLGSLVLGCCMIAAQPAQAQGFDPNRFYYYPYYYFPHNYWPSQGPQWPEPPGYPYQRPPAYMAYPPFKAPGWRYDAFEPHNYYRGSHFWLYQV